jgi:dihydropteroate synthase
VTAFLAERIRCAEAAGLERDQLAVDPGLGFGKTVAQNFELVRRLDAVAALGCVVLVGASRKSFIWKTLGTGPEEALEGSLAVAALAAERGAHILRVHDVAATVRALRVAAAVLGADAPAAR